MTPGRLRNKTGSYASRRLKKGLGFDKLAPVISCWTRPRSDSESELVADLGSDTGRRRGAIPSLTGFGLLALLAILAILAILIFPNVFDFLGAAAAAAAATDATSSGDEISLLSTGLISSISGRSSSSTSLSVSLAPPLCSLPLSS